MDDATPVSLDDLVRVVSSLAPDDPLRRVSTAVQVGDELKVVSDELVNHFVNAARADGCSWAQIGSALGVSKQGAQQRFSAPPRSADAADLPGMSRFTDRLRQALARAPVEAGALNHNFMGTEHLLLALTADPTSLASKVLAAQGLDHDSAADAVAKKIGRGPAPLSGQPGFTPRAIKALEYSWREALKLGHNYVGTEHLLLALFRGKGVAQEVMSDHGVTKAETSRRIKEALTGYLAFKSGGAPS